jgi:hypothetical protein
MAPRGDLAVSNLAMGDLAMGDLAMGDVMDPGLPMIVGAVRVRRLGQNRGG